MSGYREPALGESYTLEQAREDFRRIMAELGVPSRDYPQPVANAYEIAERASALIAFSPRSSGD